MASARLHERKSEVTRNTSIVTSDKGVVENYEDDEDTIRDGQGNEESVEGVLHLMGRQDKDGEKVPNKTNKSKNWLEKMKIRFNKIHVVSN